MRLRLLTRRLDVYLAFLLMLASFGGWAVCYERILPRAGSLANGYPIPLGTQYFRIADATDCVGSLKVELTPEKETIKLTVNGVIKALMDDFPVDGDLNSELTFNVLGQFVIGYVDVRALGVTYRVVLQEIDPIKISLQKKPSDGFTKKEFLVPGPIELKRIASREYVLSYRYLRSETASLSSLMLASFGGSLSFHTVPSTETEALQCQTPKNRMQLKPFIELLRRRFFL